MTGIEYETPQYIPDASEEANQTIGNILEKGIDIRLAYRGRQFKDLSPGEQRDVDRLIRERNFNVVQLLHRRAAGEVDFEATILAAPGEIFHDTSANNVRLKIAGRSLETSVHNLARTQRVTSTSIADLMLQRRESTSLDESEDPDATVDRTLFELRQTMKLVSKTRQEENQQTASSFRRSLTVIAARLLMLREIATAEITVSHDREVDDVHVEVKVPGKWPTVFWVSLNGNEDELAKILREQATSFTHSESSS